jgi:WD40-like Beta Propeller Repeat
MTEGPFSLLGYLSLAFLLFSAAAGEAAKAQSRFPLKRELVWSQPGSEIHTPRFSADVRFIVLVTNVHLADAAEAEGLPESYFTAMEKRAQRDPRFADPVIHLIDLAGTEKCRVTYGWHPSLSPDGTMIAFARQRSPIAGKRALAGTLGGNNIEAFNCEDKRVRVLAEPKDGYLDDPIFFRSGQTIVYTSNGALNGAWGGSVGLGTVDLRNGHVSSVLAGKSVPGIPCPPKGSTMPAKMACDSGTPATKSFPALILHFEPVGDQLVALQAVPVPSPGDLYTASRYDVRLISALPVERTLLSFKAEGSWSNPPDLTFTFQAVSDGRLLVYLHYWRLFSHKTGEWLPDPGPRNTNRTSVYSPDLRYYVAGLPAADPTDQPDHFVLYQTRTGKRLAVSPKMAGVYDATWSPDSKRFAIVVLPRGVGGLTYAEKLMVYSVP